MVGSNVVPALGRWKQEGQKFKVINHIASVRLAQAIEDPVSHQGNKIKSYAFLNLSRTDALD